MKLYVLGAVVAIFFFAKCVLMLNFIISQGPIEFLTDLQPLPKLQTRGAPDVDG